MPTGLSPEQMRIVLRRAAELEKKPGETHQAVDVREIADEVGLEPEAVSRALAEMETGALEPVRERSWLDKLIGDGAVIAERHLARPADVVQREVDSFLERHLLKLARRTGTRSLWRSDASLWSRLQRGLGELTGRFDLPRDSVVEVSVVPEGEGTRVRLTLGLEVGQKRRARALLGYLALGGGIIAVGTTVAHTVAWDAIAVAAGSGAGLVGWGDVRARQAKELAAGGEGLERLLDQLTPR